MDFVLRDLFNEVCQFSGLAADLFSKLARLRFPDRYIECPLELAEFSGSVEEFTARLEKYFQTIREE